MSVFRSRLWHIFQLGSWVEGSANAAAERLAIRRCRRFRERIFVPMIWLIGSRKGVSVPRCRRRRRRRF